ncbi:MAG TPA: endonuclease/exonuclease/phosphatase family protein [Kiritimatiellia bacterium]|nr:endonuclease/exonuclease/phosphatase family protein [Kiritimatiellia bacterium]HPC48895.1 endonuclease/exonuclease/phosphatase family protein [Kiritimatiellia bacterium]
MNIPPIIRRLLGLVEAAAFLGLLFTLAGLFGRFGWLFEIFTHFKPQFALCFLGYAAFECLARRYRRAAAGLLLAGVNALPVLLLLLPAAPVSLPRSPQPAVRLRLLQANILTHNPDASALLRLVEREQPDVVILQEPNTRWLRDLASLTNRYPVYASMPREDHFGAAIYCRTNALEAGIFQLDDPEGAPSTCARIRIGDQTLTVIGTHALAPYNAAMWAGRNRFMRMLAQHLRSLGTPLVVTGDFNNTPWSAHFRTFLRESGLIDSAQGRGPLPTWPASLPFLRIPLDHGLHSSDVRIINRRRGPDIGSDHLPLIFDLAF